MCVDVQSQEFLRAFLAINKRLYLYTVTLTPSHSDADDVFQQTSMILLQRWEEYDQSRSFLAWACGIARNQARRYMAERGRQDELLGDEAAMVIQEVLEDTEGAINERLDALKACLEKLSRDQKTLVKQCYAGSQTMQSLAESLNMTPNAIYNRLKRLREVLHQCVDRTVLARQSP